MRLLLFGMMLVGCSVLFMIVLTLGLKFEKENENDLKDKIDFDPGKQSHYPLNQARPNFGRFFVFKCFLDCFPVLVGIRSLVTS